MKILIALFLLALGTLRPASANFHVWDIAEVYSNADGSAQFARLTTTVSGQDVLSGHTLTLSSPTKTFTFVSNLPSSDTANRSFLIGTSNLESLYGIIPDYVLPTGFLEVGATLSFSGVDTVSLAKLPKDGAHSLDALAGTDAPDKVKVIATPTMINFAGARFVIGDFKPYKGAYNGLVRSAGFAFENSGFLNTKVTPAGGFTSKLVLAGKKFSAKGKLDTSGNATVLLDKGTLTLALHLDLLLGDGGIAQGTINGSVTRTTFGTVPFTLSLAAKDHAGLVPALGNAKKPVNFTMSLAPTDAALSPRGFSIGAVTVSKSGKIKAAGTLADGTKFSQSVSMSANGEWPLFVPLYAKKGVILGAPRLSSGGISQVGFVDWFRPADVKAKTFPAGFTVRTKVEGRVAQLPSTSTLLSFIGSPANPVTLDIGTAFPTAEVRETVTISDKDLITIPATPAKLAMTFTRSKLTFKGTFFDVAANKARTFNAVMSANGMRGFYSDEAQGGFVALTNLIPATIYTIKDGTIPLNSTVRLTEALVTGAGPDGFFVQAKQGDAGFLGVDNSGLFVQLPGANQSIQAGLRLSFTATVVDRGETRALSGPTDFPDLANLDILPTPVLVTAAEIGFLGSRSVALDGVLVRLGRCEVTAAGEFPGDDFTIADTTGSTLAAGFGSAFSVGQNAQLLSVIGIQSVGDTGPPRLLIRAASDIPLNALTFNVAQGTIGLGAVSATTSPTALMAQIVEARTLAAFVTITSSDPSILTVTGGGVTIPSGSTSAPVLLSGISTGTVTLTATFGSVTVTATVNVVGPG
jgi:hypothetical protein